MGTPFERFELTHDALAGQMDKVIQIIKARNDADKDKSNDVNLEQMVELRESLASSKKMAALFERDVEGNTRDMNRIAAAFLDNAFSKYQAIESEENKKALWEATDLNLVLIQNIIEAGECETCRN